jgi:hypothetical protein
VEVLAFFFFHSIVSFMNLIILAVRELSAVQITSLFVGFKLNCSNIYIYICRLLLQTKVEWWLWWKALEGLFLFHRYQRLVLKHGLHDP